VILACSNYIWNSETDKQIDRIFGVKYDDKMIHSKGEYVFSKQNRFWVHYNENGRKLVIHTRQLSMNVMNSMLIEIGKIVKNHLNQL